MAKETTKTDGEELASTFVARLRVHREDTHAGEPLQAASFTTALLQDAIRAGASDIHIDPDSRGLRVRFRVDGILYEVARLDVDDGQRMVRFRGHTFSDR